VVMQTMQREEIGIGAVLLGEFNSVRMALLQTGNSNKEGSSKT
jgi:hypothetical protein